STLCERIGVTSRTPVADNDHPLAEKLFKELQEAKLPPPPTDCLAPIGARQLLPGMLKGVRAEFSAASSREPAIYRGRRFLIEAVNAINGTDAKKLYATLQAPAKKRTAIADAKLDDEGKRLKDDEPDLDGVIIVENAAASTALPGGDAAPGAQGNEPGASATG